MTLRNATLTDLPAIVAIYNSTVPGRLVTADTEPVSVESRMPWFESHNPHTRPLWVYEEAGAVQAFVSFKSFYGRPAYNGTAEIAIYLHENARGQGLGRKLLRHALENSPSMGIKTILAFIFGHNTPSLRLFETEGFVRWGFLPAVAELDGVERDLVILGKRLP